MKRQVNRPFLRIVSVARKGGKKEKYLSVAIHFGKNQTKTIKSFGNVLIAENWDRAIEFMLEVLRVYYRDEKLKYTGSR